MSGLVIVGGGASGLATARNYREAGGEGPVTILTPETDAPYARPALSKGFLQGKAEAGDIGLQDEDFYSDNDVELRREVTVEALDTGKRELTPRRRRDARLRHRRARHRLRAVPAPDPRRRRPGHPHAALAGRRPRPARARRGRPHRGRHRAPGSSAARPPPRWPCAACA